MVSQSVNQTEELITWVDEHDRVLGLKPRSDFHDGKYIHRSVGLLLFNTQGQILVCRRDKTKIRSPGLFSYSVSGTVGDESYIQCIEREVREELEREFAYTPLFKYVDIQVGKDAQIKYIFHATCVTGYESIYNNEADTCQWVDSTVLLQDMCDHPQKYTSGFIKGFGMYCEKHAYNVPYIKD